ncbi:unnamed protein product [Rotaria socialis]|uniref:Uncharacterized protein n=1 Tax=Rotaria socialis TaxID=392032 RepID=A0A817SB81_9BILA|nr:unnamed protein product [Rotaria socialis]CAF3414499.1 unnamed protein product [Rotaria socialis]CAF3454291.1 unnamed protein product [Rotaria socialis]CAF4253216.1 unnamed protein product [Rotaria socialis]CAF4508206.1 unnamed protein product [Rotaria socialis]
MQRMNHQFARMLRIQIVWFLIATLTLFEVKLYPTITMNSRKVCDTRQIELLTPTIAFLIYSSYQCVSVYAYMLISATYRSGLKKTLVEIYGRITRRAIA